MPNNQPKSDELDNVISWENATFEQKIDGILEIARYGEGGGQGQQEAKDLLLPLIRQRQSAHTVEVLERLKRHMHSNVIVPGISFTKSEYVDVASIDAAIKEEEKKDNG